MKKLSAHPTLTIQIDFALAEEYEDIYRRAITSRGENEQTLEEFIVRFVENRLADEIAFLEEEAVNARR